MKLQLTTMLILLAFTSTSALAAKKDKMKMMSMTPEQRQTMAGTHDKMAACLRSDKSLEECQKEMMQSCHEMMGKDGCPMMGQMKDKMKMDVKESP